MLRPSHAAFGMLLAVIALFGCGGGDAPRTDPARDNLRMVAVMCGRFSGMNQGASPANIDELKAFARKQPALTPGGFDDKIFISPRDQEAYVIVKGASAGVPGMGEKKIMVHEKTGKDGKRLVAYSTVEIDELDEAAFSAARSKK